MHKKCVFQISMILVSIFAYLPISAETASNIKLSSADIEKIIKDTMRRTLETAIKEKPLEVAKYLAQYNPGAVVAGTGTSLSSSHLALVLESKAGVPLPSGDFISKLPEAILTNAEAGAVRFVKVGEDEKIETDFGC